ncbi:unnamed protein product [Moneuplotes crassus]|uniref:FCP1 homology domain-containing protein n=1 Tax=Euplotes crassus TaxID=5936 RepID=A0AAD1YAD1_EUPCR|nr:unnamed protein product [Moneuplotes crassus]
MAENKILRVQKTLRAKYQKSEQQRLARITQKTASTTLVKPHDEVESLPSPQYNDGEEQREDIRSSFLLENSTASSQSKKKKKFTSLFRCCFGVKQTSEVKPYNKMSSLDKSISGELPSANLHMIKNNSNYRRLRSEINPHGGLRSKLSIPTKEEYKENTKAQGNSYFESNLSMLGQQLKENKGRKTLILCLDEVLLHYRIGAEESGDGDYEFCLNMKGKARIINVFKRPHLDEFLQKMSEIYEIIFFSNKREDFANPVINFIDSNKVAAGRLYRDSCIVKEGVFIKNIKKLGRNMSSIVVLDNYSVSYLYNIENTVPIKSWYGENMEDNELKDMLPILQSFAKLKDVRTTIAKIAKEVQGANLPINIDPKYQGELEILNKAGKGLDSLVQENKEEASSVQSKRFKETLKNAALFTCCQITHGEMQKYSNRIFKTKGDIDKTLNQSLMSESEIGFSQRQSKAKPHHQKNFSTPNYIDGRPKILDKDNIKCSKEDMKFMEVESENSFMNQFIKYLVQSRIQWFNQKSLSNQLSLKKRKRECYHEEDIFFCYHISIFKIRADIGNFFLGYIGRF